MQLLRAAAFLGAPLPRPLVDSEPFSQPSSSSSSSYGIHRALSYFLDVHYARYSFLGIHHAMPAPPRRPLRPLVLPSAAAAC